MAQNLAVNSSSQPDKPLIIKPSHGWRALGLQELWRAREVLWYMATRDVLIKYKQSLLGVAWAAVVPFVTMVVFGSMFKVTGRVPKFPGVPYSLATFCALAPWQLFAQSLSRSGNSLVASSNVITKIYFPRLISPIAPILSNVVDFLIAFGVLVAMIAFFHMKGAMTGVTFDSQGAPIQPYHFVFGWQLLMLPFFLVLTIIAALSVSLWLSALNAIYRDIHHVIPFLLQLWMLATPVVYPSKSFLDYQATHYPNQPWLVTLYFLNPMAGVVEGFRWAILGVDPPPLHLMGLSALAMRILLISGAYFFRRMERSFVDLV